MLLVIKWSEMEGGSYYIDKDKYSRVHERRDEYIYDAYCGTYHFNKATKKVTLDDGVRIREVSCLEWYVEQEG